MYVNLILYLYSVETLTISRLYQYLSLPCTTISDFIGRTAFHIQEYFEYYFRNIWICHLAYITCHAYIYLGHGDYVCQSYYASHAGDAGREGNTFHAGHTGHAGHAGHAGCTGHTGQAGHTNYKIN